MVELAADGRRPRRRGARRRTARRRRLRRRLLLGHDEYWERIAGGYALIASNPALRDGDHVLQISHGNTLLSLMQRFAPEGYDLSERPANGSVSEFDLDTDADFASALTVVSYNRR